MAYPRHFALLSWSNRELAEALFAIQLLSPTGRGFCDIVWATAEHRELGRRQGVSVGKLLSRALDSQ
jgi:hypothetical protein